MVSCRETTIRSVVNMQFAVVNKGGNNRRPLTKGRNLSNEAMHTIQALKRANLNTNNINSKNSVSYSVTLRHVLDSKFSRLLKFDMMAVLRELLRQNHCLLALKVFEEIRNEQWYKPQVSLYVDMLTVLARNGLLEQVELLHMYLRAERNLEPETEGFNALLRTLMSLKLTNLVIDCYNLAKTLGCEPDRPTFRILINGLEEAIGNSGASAVMKQDAQRYYGDSLDFLEEEEEEEESVGSKTEV
ncbi:hypothetical protein K2173_012492 [Erythroxylum novogranatense]|uniref:Uncharacterized protein n=1 Tax=Erythroxylum novogranatense TaxID=1862640 RepID=A0AAV8TM22_9ROSI|nr:hypothetical protein K2173_012492 [Erythroxylum novogranatense]